MMNKPLTPSSGWTVIARCYTSRGPSSGPRPATHAEDLLYLVPLGRDGLTLVDPDVAPENDGSQKLEEDRGFRWSVMKEQDYDTDAIPWIRDQRATSRLVTYKNAGRSAARTRAKEN